eukprot:10708807-Alexandrium_andersonii.AAC.1
MATSARGSVSFPAPCARLPLISMYFQLARLVATHHQALRLQIGLHWLDAWRNITSTVHPATMAL